MKVSRREFSLLILLVTIGVAYLLYAFLFSPMLDRISEARITLAQSQAELTNYRQTIAKYDVNKLLQEQQDKVSAIEEKAKPLLPAVDYGQITTFIQQIAQTQNARVSAVTFAAEALYDTAVTDNTNKTVQTATYPLKQAADTYRRNTAAASSDEAASPSSSPAAAPTGSSASSGASGTSGASGNKTLSGATVNRLTVDIQFNNATYTQIIGFIKQLESYGRAIYLDNIQITAAQTGGNLNATLEYSFMQAEKLTDADTGLAVVTPPLGTGRTDPFAG